MGGGGGGGRGREVFDVHQRTERGRRGKILRDQ